MTTSRKSHQTMLRGFAQMIVGSAVQGFSGLVRSKLIAATLGPMGIGVYGLLYSLMQTVILMGSMGQDIAGPRRIAQSENEPDELELSRSIWALVVLVAALAAASGTVLLLGHRQIAKLFHMPEAEVAWLSLAVVLGILAVVPVAILQGLRRIDKLARLHIDAGLASLIIGGAAIIFLGRAGIVTSMVMTPACLLVLGLHAVAKVLRGKSLSRPSGVSPAVLDLVLTGGPFMVAGALTIGSGLAARGMVQHSLGAISLGLYAAATTLGMTYLPLLLNALGADYLPRMSALVGRPREASQLVSEQTEISLLIIVPVALGIISIAPWLMVVLFSAEFRPATLILQLLVLADILRVAAWPIGFVLLARGEGWVLIGIDLCAQGAFLALTMITAGHWGVTATGAAFPLASLLSATLVYFVVRRRLPILLGKNSILLLASGLVITSLTIAISSQQAVLGAAFGLMAAICFTAFGLLRVARLTEAKGRLRPLPGLVRRLLQRAGIIS